MAHTHEYIGNVGRRWKVEGEEMGVGEEYHQNTCSHVLSSQRLNENIYIVDPEVPKLVEGPRGGISSERDRL